MDKLVSLGAAQMVTDKPRAYQLAPAPPGTSGGPGAGEEVTPSAA
jgi:hypothetical protein